MSKSITISSGEEKSFVDAGVGAELPGPDGQLVVGRVGHAEVPELSVVNISVTSDHLAVKK